MYNLYFKKTDDKILSTTEKPFKTEEEMEKYLMDEQGMFSDIFLFKRQIRAGRDIPDMIGVDRDNNVVIVENKNVPINEDILPQILRYAFWAETNPDSLKAMWLEEKDKPEDIAIDWDNITIRLIIFAPSIKLSVPRLLKKINYDVELIEIKRFEINKNEIILMNRLEEEAEIKVKTAKGLGAYNKEFHKQHRNKKSVDLFFKVVEEIEKIIGNKEWELETKLNKHYVSFKHGFFNFFGIEWIGAKSFQIFLKIKKEQLPKLKKICPYEINYDDRWNQATIRYDENINIKKLEDVLELTHLLFTKR